MDLSLSLPKRSFGFGSVDLTECLENFIEPEQMDKCGYKCAKCKKVDNMTKDFSVFRFPNVLVIHLKRFSRREKLSTTVNVPKTLDMRPFAPHSCK
jgi:ubiquitin C-terminal hydrolase